MHQRFLFALLLVWCGASAALAQRVNGRFVTSLYAWQRDDTIGVQHTYALGYQGLQFDVYQKDISLHAYLQGFNDFGGYTLDPPRISSGPQVRFYNLFLKVSKIANVLDLSLGRQPVYAGAGNGTIDGLLSRLQLAEGKAIVVGYAGGVPPPYQKAAVTENLDKNFMVGGQFIASPFGGMRFAGSYMNRRTEQPSYFAIRRDSINNALGVLVNPEPYSEQFLGFDANYRGTAPVSLYGRYEYDLNYDQISRGQLFSRLTITDRFAITGEYIYRSPRIPFHSYFSIFPRNSVKEIEAGAEYSFATSWRASGKFALVSYSSDDNRRYTLGLTNDYGGLSYSGSTGFDGELNSFSGQFYYPLLGRVLVPSLGLTYAEYRLSREAPVEHVFAGVLGSTVRPVPSFSFDLQLQWLNNRIAKRDIRGFFKLTYWFSEDLKLFQ
jgi:hypothetical protein